MTSLVLYVFLAGVAAGPAAVPPPQPWSPVLDCARRVYAMDTLICETPALLAVAREVEAAYARARLRLPAEQAGRLEADQLAWSKRRNMCAFERRASACVGRLQVKRTKSLNGRR